MLNTQIEQLERFPFEEKYTETQVIVFRGLFNLFRISQKHAERQAGVLSVEQLKLFKEYHLAATAYETSVAQKGFELEQQQTALEKQMQATMNDIQSHRKAIDKIDKRIENIKENENALLTQFGNQLGDELPTLNNNNHKKKEKKGWFSKHFRT